MSAPRIDVERYHADGYAVVQLLPPEEAAELRVVIDSILDAHRAPTVDASFHRSENQHLGDRVEGYGAKAKHYYFHLITDARFVAAQRALHHPRVLGAVAAILGEPLILDNASLFAAEPGTRYALPWHRDVIQIPQDEIVEEAIYSADRFHNSVQINLALAADATLWVVPGSHRRPNTAQERAAFAGSKHYAPLDAAMPGGVRVDLAPGQAALYNNNLIHRGWNPGFGSPRRALHLGYHGASRPPTWHFYLLDESRFTPEYRASMSPEMRAMIDAYFACRRAFPDMRATFPQAAARA